MKEIRFSEALGTDELVTRLRVPEAVTEISTKAMHDFTFRYYVGMLNNNIGETWSTNEE
jgi:hypothetical protein